VRGITGTHIVLQFFVIWVSTKKGDNNHIASNLVSTNHHYLPKID